MSRTVRVLPDEPAIAKQFDYTLPDEFADDVRLGTVVRVSLHGRRVRGWVVDDDVEPDTGRALQPIAKVTGWGPAPELIDLAAWAAWRWAGRPATFLRTATAERAVRALPTPTVAGTPLPEPAEASATSAFTGAGATVRLPPAADVYPYALAAVRTGDALILAPSVAAARHLGLRLRRAGAPVAVMPGDWALARAGGSVVGARAAAWAPLARPAAFLVIDEHDETYQEERAPTWHARDVVLERARRAGVPVVLTSPAPSLEAMATGLPLVVPSRSAERGGWPVVQVIDRRRDDLGRLGLYSEQLVAGLRGAARALCVLNRRGRSMLLACGMCGDLTRCELCDGGMRQHEDATLVCGRCGGDRPMVCQSCGATRLKNLRVGVSRAREELEALVGGRVVEVTGDTAGQDLPDAGVYVGTEAVLHQVRGGVDVVAFLEFDQELLAPRYRAGEEALALLVRAARLVGGRSSGGKVLVQTRLPRHEVLLGAVHADPERWAAVERARRRELDLPPFSAQAEISGAAAGSFVERMGRPPGTEVRGPVDGHWLVRAPDHVVLSEALAGVERPKGRLRVAVDPPRV